MQRRSSAAQGRQQKEVPSSRSHPPRATGRDRLREISYERLPHSTKLSRFEMEEAEASERPGRHTATVCGAAVAVMREGRHSKAEKAPKEGERKEGRVERFVESVRRPCLRRRGTREENHVFWFANKRRLFRHEALLH